MRRWSNEIQEAINSSHPMVQFHALSLLHQIRQSDRLAVSKLVTQLTKSKAYAMDGKILLQYESLAESLYYKHDLQEAIIQMDMAVRAPDGNFYEKCSQVISQTVPSDNAPRPFFDFLEGCLRNKSEMVIFEAAR